MRRLSTSQGGSDRRSLRVALPGIPNFVHLPAHLALRLGIFEVRGLEVEIRGAESGFACFGMVSSGAVDVAWTSTVGMLRAAARGHASHLRMAISPVPRLDIQIAALPEVKRCEDFRGRPVAVQGPGTFTHAMLDAYLAQCGLRIEHDVQQVHSRPEDFGLLLSEGRAVGCAGHADDLAEARYELCPDLKILANAWEYLPNFHYASYVMTTELIEGRREVAAEFVAAIREATAWLIDPLNHTEVIRRAAEITTQPVEVVRNSYEMYIQGGLFTMDHEAALSHAMLRETAQHQIALGIIDRVPNLDEVVEMSLNVNEES